MRYELGQRVRTHGKYNEGTSGLRKGMLEWSNKKMTGEQRKFQLICDRQHMQGSYNEETVDPHGIKCTEIVSQLKEGE